ncbi:hypothetical protein HPB51_002816 [Rhipicephalus microplus]|uniref:Tudor domain-containing protein n=1 Tax=Rhipicephalus microplus TaxID=6941 RepID=A0A9J6EXJ8_RHIMP|nr:hypothetical protein HPB51_002816 [Rhipicephalus microplus]
MLSRVRSEREQVLNTKRIANYQNRVDCGDFVASRSPEDKRWYRACVTKKTASGHTVRYIDYGNEESNTDIFPLQPTHLTVPAATVRVLTSDPMSFRVGQLLSFVVESVDGGEVRGTVTSEDDGKEMGTCALAPWNSGLDAGEPVASPSPAKAAAAPAAPHKKLDFSVSGEAGKRMTGEMRLLRYDTLVLAALRHKVHSYFMRNKLPMAEKLRNGMINDPEMDMSAISTHTMQRMLNDLGFAFRKRKRNSVLLERDNIVI